MVATRFRRYNPLIDLAFWLFILGFASISALRYVSGLPSGFVQPAKFAINILGYVTWLLTVFLICARFMRDEYAEGLWQKSAAMFTYVLVLLPAILVVASWLYQSYDAALTAPPTAAERAAIAAYPRPIIWQWSGAMYLLLYLAAYMPFLFVALYKWNRWRDN
jgi:hypothetical protein